jgi:hypothetical protein
MQCPEREALDAYTMSRAAAAVVVAKFFHRNVEMRFPRRYCSGGVTSNISGCPTMLWQIDHAPI